MEQKINIGEVSISEYNLIMKQLSTGQISDCLDLFMRLRQLGIDFQQKMQMPPPPNINDLPLNP